MPEPKQIHEFTLDTWNTHSKLVISDLTLQHEDSSRPSLKQLDFSWQGFGKIGIIGASGAGKSTLINVLGGFLQPNTAEIEISRTFYINLYHGKVAKADSLYSAASVHF